MLLETKTVEKPWGRDVLPAPFTAPAGKRIGEIWFVPPKELSQLSPGEYRLQVECEPGVMGRVHRLSLVSSRVIARVDTRYDRVIETLFDLSLHYAARDQEKKFRGRDAVETARIIGASDVVVASVACTSR